MVRTELTLRLPNSPGAAASVFRLLAEEHIHTAALSLAPTGHLRLLVDNPVRALGALRLQRYHVESREVVFLTMSATADALAPVLALIGDAGVNVEYAYSVSSGPGRDGGVVLGVDDAQRAAAAAGV